MEPYAYILYLAADESISGWEFLLLVPKSPHVSQRCTSGNRPKWLRPGGLIILFAFASRSSTSTSS